MDEKLRHSMGMYDEARLENNSEAQQIVSNIETVKVSPQYAEAQNGIYVDVGPKVAVQEGEYQAVTNNAISEKIRNKTKEKLEKLKELGIEYTYISEEKREEYIKAFVTAEYITQYPDLRSADKIGTPTANGEIQGCIQIHRALSDGSTKILSYVEKSIFDSYISSNNIKAAEHFTLDNAGNIVIAGWTRVTTNVTSNVPNVENITNNIEYTLTTNSINYKSLVEPYTMPFDLLWTFTVMGNDADFAYNVAQLALNSKIVFTVQDNISTIITDNIEEYDRQEKIEKEAEITVTIDNTPAPEPAPEETTEEVTTEPTPQIDTYTKNVKIEAENPAISYKTQTTIKTETCTTNIDLTEADTWVVKYKNILSNTIPNEIVGESEVEKIEDTQYELINTATLSTDSEIDQELLNYKIEQCGGNDQYQQKETEGKISGSIGTIYYTTYSRTINHTITNKTSTSQNMYVQGTPTVTEKSDFVVLFRNSASAKTNILNTPDWFFEALEQSKKANDLVDTVKYLFYKATDNDYGIAKFNFNLFSPDSFTAVGGIYGNTIEEKVWFALRAEGYSKEAVAGVMGNIYAESGFNPSVVEKGSGIGFGLCQWSFGRRTQLEAYAQSKGVEPSDVDTQIEFLLTEINRGVGPAQGYAKNQIITYKGYTRVMWENASTPEDAATAFCWTFERPGIPNMSRRTEKAREYYEMYGNVENGGSTN